MNISNVHHEVVASATGFAGTGGGQSAGGAEQAPAASSDSCFNRVAIAPGSRDEKSKTEAFYTYRKWLGHKAQEDTTSVTDLNLKGSWNSLYNEPVRALDKVPEGLAQTFPNLQNLHLQGNDIPVLDDNSFGGKMEHLRKIDLKGNGLAYIGTLTQNTLPALEELDVSSPSTTKYYRQAMAKYLEYKEDHDAYWRDREVRGISEDRSGEGIKFFADPRKPVKPEPFIVKLSNIQNLPAGCVVKVNKESYRALKKEQNGVSVISIKFLDEEKTNYTGVYRVQVTHTSRPWLETGAKV